jgi:hypothetical protein
MGDERTYELVREDFTEQQMAEMHEALVVRLGDQENLEAKKKQENVTINAVIKGVAKEVHDLRANLANRYQMVKVEVLAVMDRPTLGTKTIIRVDTGAEVRTEPMTAREKQEQQSFGFQEPGQE